MEQSRDGEARLDACEACLDYHFTNRKLLALALTHASDKASHIEAMADEEDGKLDPEAMLDNERLEFLGDSVLGMVVCEELFNSYPQATEGELTAVKSVVVSRSVLARLTDKIGVAEFMSLGKGMTTYARLPESLRANVFEAVVAAIYLDGGLEAASRFVLAHVRDEITLVERNKHRKNYKSVLQQQAQRDFSITPTYRVVSEEGPDHIKEFEVTAVIGRREYATGRGKSKKDAEQEAARRALEVLRSEREAEEAARAADEEDALED